MEGPKERPDNSTFRKGTEMNKNNKREVSPEVAEALDKFKNNPRIKEAIERARGLQKIELGKYGIRSSTPQVTTHSPVLRNKKTRAVKPPVTIEEAALARPAEVDPPIVTLRNGQLTLLGIKDL